MLLVWSFFVQDIHYCDYFSVLLDSFFLCGGVQLAITFLVFRIKLLQILILITCDLQLCSKYLVLQQFVKLFSTEVIPDRGTGRNQTNMKKKDSE